MDSWQEQMVREKEKTAEVQLISDYWDFQNFLQPSRFVKRGETNLPISLRSNTFA